MSAIRVTESTGSLGTIQISDGSGNFLSGSLVAGTNVSIVNNGTGSFTINAAAGAGGSTIGDAEDGDYTDGLFIDFENSTTARCCRRPGHSLQTVPEPNRQSHRGSICPSGPFARRRARLNRTASSIRNPSGAAHRRRRSLTAPSCRRAHLSR